MAVALAFVPVALALAPTASADSHRANLGIRVTVVDRCAATSANGASPAALGPDCGTATAVTVVREPTALTSAETTAPIQRSSDAGGTSVRYVTIVY